MNKTPSKRLESLDILRGFDLFFLEAIGNLIHPLAAAIDSDWFNQLTGGFKHVPWEGFSPWDLIMPLFMFMAGASMPFALSRYKTDPNKKHLYFRIIKRVLLLWIFGMMCQGNLLTFEFESFHFYSNTLQAIAIGYLGSALLFLNFRFKIQLLISLALLVLYWFLMMFVSVDGFGAGSFTPQANLAEWVDQQVLGQFRDAVIHESNNTWRFNPNYSYTWILSSLNFIVTVMTGVFAGTILKSAQSHLLKLKYLFGFGFLQVLLGWIWGVQMPVIKTIWTSSMVLVSSGYCFLLMGLFYYWIDYKGNTKGLSWLKVYGMNSIVAYLLASIVNFGCIGQSVFFGLEQFLGDYYRVLIALSNISIIYLILYLLRKNNIYLKV